MPAMLSISFMAIEKVKFDRYDADSDWSENDMRVWYQNVLESEFVEMSIFCLTFENLKEIQYFMTDLHEDYFFFFQFRYDQAK